MIWRTCLRNGQRTVISITEDFQRNPGHTGSPSLSFSFHRSLKNCSLQKLIHHSSIYGKTPVYFEYNFCKTLTEDPNKLAMDNVNFKKKSSILIVTRTFSSLMPNKALSLIRISVSSVIGKDFPLEDIFQYMGGASHLFYQKPKKGVFRHGHTMRNPPVVLQLPGTESVLGLLQAEDPPPRAAVVQREARLHV